MTRLACAALLCLAAAAGCQATARTMPPASSAAGRTDAARPEAAPAWATGLRQWTETWRQAQIKAGKTNAWAGKWVFAVGSSSPQASPKSAFGKAEARRDAMFHLRRRLAAELGAGRRRFKLPRLVEEGRYVRPVTRYGRAMYGATALYRMDRDAFNELNRPAPR